MRNVIRIENVGFLEENLNQGVNKLVIVSSLNSGFPEGVRIRGYFSRLQLNQQRVDQLGIPWNILPGDIFLQINGLSNILYPFIKELKVR